MILLKTEHQRCLKAPVEWVQFIRTFNRKKTQPLCSSNQHKHSCRWALPLEGNLADSVCAQQCEDTGMRLLAGKTSVLYHKHCREHRLPRSTEPLHSLQAAPAQKTGHTPLDVMTRVRKCCSRGVSSQSRFRYTQKSMASAGGKGTGSSVPLSGSSGTVFSVRVSGSGGS